MKKRFLAATLLLLAAMVATPPVQARSYDDDDDGGRSYARRYAPTRASREYREDDEGYRRPVYRGRRTTKPASRGRQRAIVRKQARPAAKVAAKPSQPQAPAPAGGANTVASNVADPGLAAGAKVASLAANAPADPPPPAALADHGRQHVAVPGGPAPGNAPKMRACLTKAARELLDRIEAEFGPVQIVSTCRPGSRIPGSGVLSRHHHREAIDFEAGKRKGQIVKWLIANHKTGGIMTYSNFSHIHVDIGYRFVALNAHG